MNKSYPIPPIPKPRMTKRDKWLDPPRPTVARYWAFKDLVRLHKVEVPESGALIIFKIPMPESWSKKKKEKMRWKPHQQKPDIDNLLKALLDAVYDEDCCVWNIRELSKIWSYNGSILINS